MAGETSLEKLLSSMAPKLLDGDYIFCCLKVVTANALKELQPLATFSEEEGLSLVVSKPRADDFGISYDCVFKVITLTVHSSLQAVGLTAAVSTALATEGISANVIAAFHHDHLLVQADQAAQALVVLHDLARLHSS